jgi:hypothetical protein
MPKLSKLTVALQDGYSNDHVRIELDGRLVSSQTDLSTRYQIGLAAQVETEVVPGPHVLQVSLPNRGLSAQAPLEIDGDCNVSVSLVNGELSVRTSSEPFRYA